MSAFFFCGIIELPVAYASSSTAKPNSADVQSTHSSPMRDRCTPSEREVEQRLGDEVTVAHRVERVLERRREAEIGRGAVRDRAAATSPRARPLRAATRRAASIVASNRSTSRASAQPCASRWCASSTGWARCTWVYPGRYASPTSDRAIEQHLLQAEDTGGNAAELALAPQPQRRRDLVVAAPPGVQLAADLAGDLGDPSLDRRVDVLVGGLRTRTSRRRARRRRGRGAEKIAAASSPSSSPARTRPRTCAREPTMSSAASRWSKRTDAVNASSSSAGPDPKRPCHRVQRVTTSSAPCLALRPRLHAETPDPHEPLGVAVAERVGCVVGREPVVVQRMRAATPVHEAPAGLEPKPHLAGDEPLASRRRTRRTPA